MIIRYNRRDFIRTGAWAGLGAYLTTTRGWAQNSPNNKLNVGIIGANGKGKSNTEAVGGTENIVALCDIDEGRLAETAAKFPQARTFTDWRKLLELPNLDAIIVSIPDHSHAVCSVTSMKLGKHVYCEKPLTRTIWEARMMTEMAASNPQLATQMGNAGHSSPGMRRVVELVQAGAIGDVREAHCWTDRPIWPQGIGRPTDTPSVPAHINWDVWLGPAPERPYHPAYHPFKWRGFWDFGTGALGDMGCHIIDATYWALKLTAPVAIRAEAADPRMTETGPLWMIVRYEFPARGELPPVRLTWYDGGKLPPDELFRGEAPSKNGTIMVGDKGTLYIPRDRGGPPILTPREKFADFQPPEPSLPTPASHYAEWIEACKTGTQTYDNFVYAGALTESVLLGNVAYRMNKKIEWDAKNLRVKNAGYTEATGLIKPEYRRGWTL